MVFEVEISQALYGQEFEAGNSGITREIIMQYITAGILFPDEIRQAEQILRQLSKNSS
jgi:hypothetical protein